MKIGIITHYYKSENYGGNLQSYALCAALHKMGHTAEQISFDKKRGAKALRRVRYFLSGERNKIKNTCRGIHSGLNKRGRAIYSFNQEVVPHSTSVYSSKTIKNCVNDYDAFITGSDQVWHPQVVCDEYLLDFVPSDKVKISYAASIASQTIPEDIALRYKRAFESFDAISLRENDVVPLIKGLYRGEVSWTLDPTLLLDAEDWRSIATPIDIEEEYVFCYFLGNNEDSRRLVSEYANKHGLKIVTLPYLIGTFRNCDKEFGDYPLYSVSPQQLISLIDNAKFVFTDSFHATVFSLILKKEFCVFSRDVRRQMESRIVSLLSIFDLPERFCNSDDCENLDYIESLSQIDYSTEFEKYENLKKESLDYLKANLKGKDNKSKKKIEIIDPAMCSGCYACASACPKSCITMRSDTEGFWYPEIDERNCIDCGLCQKVCPIISSTNNKKSEINCTAYAAYTTNNEIRSNSSSGGVFTEIAAWVIKKGGVVFGAAFDSELNVKHISVEKNEDLYMLRGSKYVQSSIGDAYQQAENYLKEGRLVMFSGTPCQIGGLYSYLKKDYDNLITQDIICHGIPSPAVWQKYLRHIENSYGSRVVSVSFRDKNSGWKSYGVRFELENGSIRVIPSRNVVYMKGFLNDLCLRPSCYKCAFRQDIRQSDFTLADFWGVEKLLPRLDDGKGTSLVFVNSSKSAKVLNELDLDKERIDSRQSAIGYNLSMVKNPRRPIRREKYVSDVLNDGFEGINDKYFKISRLTMIKNKCKRVLRRLLKG